MLFRIIILLIVIGFTWLLLAIPTLTKKIFFRPFLSHSYLDGQLKYQITAILLAFFTLILVFMVAPTSFNKYFAIGNISAPVVPVPVVGISPAPNETWLQIGTNFAFIITAVTFIFIYFQLIKGKKIQKQYFHLFFWVIVFSLMNSFTEEMITRFSVIALLDTLIPLSYIYLVSAFIFGSVHYFGTPGKIPGVLLAGFLGWFLAKSIGETHGFFWAWLIHFLQDVVIITGLFFQKFALNKKNG
jgi:hypothetical protein